MKKLQQYRLNFVTLDSVGFSEFPAILNPKYHDYFNRSGRPHYFVIESKCQKESLSSSWQTDLLHKLKKMKTFSLRNNNKIVETFLECDRHIDSVCVFKFGDELRKDKDRATEALAVLRDGFVLVHADGEFTEYERYLRSPSGLRAGGSLFCIRGERFALRNIFSLDIINSKGAQAKFVPTKWESALSLSITSSHAVMSKRNWNIRIVPDFKREINIAVKKLVEYSDKELADMKAKGITPNPKKYPGLDRVKYTVLSDEEDDIEFEIVETVEPKKIEAIDGCGIGSMSLFDHIFDQLQLTESEKEYGYVQQIRAPYIKGMLCGVDIVALADELQVDTLVDIYGEEFDPRECDMILPKSMFKGADLFNNIQEYIDALDAQFSYEGEVYDLFPNHEWLRIANVNKEKEPMREMTYQYLQAMLNLNPNDLVTLARPFMDTIREGVTKDISIAKKFLGMVYHDDGDYYKSMLGKAQEMLEICPPLFNHPAIQSKLIDTVETSIKDLQSKGRVPVHGSYHFIVGDLTILFANTKERVEQVKAGKRNAKLLDSDDFTFLKKGDNYSPDTLGESIVYRSPLIDASEVRKIMFTKNAFGDRHFHHLKGLIILNSYEPTALCMGGADYDGDKIYKTEEKLLMQAYQPNMPIIISPLETYDAPVMFISDVETHASLVEVDKRTLDNETGVFTDMGTFDIAKYYDTRLKYTQALYIVQNAKCEQDYINIINKFCYKRKSEIKSPMDLVNVLKSELQIKLKQIGYDLTIIRVCQAGEIDFPKHGVRFVMPANVKTRGILQWLKPVKFAERNEKRKEYNLKYQQEIMMGTKLEQKPLVPYDTPLQRLYDFVQAEWATIKETLKTNTLDVNEYLMGKNIDKAEFSKLYPKVKEIEFRYSKELFELRNLCISQKYDEEQRMKLYRAHFDKFIAETEVLTTDRKTLASICCHITFAEKSQNNRSNSFPFVVAYDGILMNLAEYNFNSVRIIPVKELDHDKTIHSGSLIIEDGVATHNATGIKFDFDFKDMPNGIYNIFAVKGRHFIQLPMSLTADDKKNLVAHYYDRKMKEDTTGKEKKVHVIPVVQHVDYEFVINGLQHYKQTSNSLIPLLQAYNTFKFVEVEIPNKPGVKYVGAEVNGVVVGTVARKDKTKVKDNNLINMSEFIGHIATVGDMKASGQKAINVHAKIATNVSAKKYDLDKYHAKCNLKTWYWNRPWVEISSFQNFEFVNVEFSNNKPALGEVFSRVNIKVNGVVHHFYVQRHNPKQGEDSKGIVISSIVNSVDGSVIPLTKSSYNEFGEQITVSNIHIDLEASVLRACSYFNAKKAVLEIEAEEKAKAIKKAVEEEIKAEERALLIEISQEETLEYHIRKELNKAFNDGMDRFILTEQIAI